MAGQRRDRLTGPAQTAERMHIRTRRGHRFHLPGAPVQTVRASPVVRSVAIAGADYPGVRFTVEVEAGQTVAKGAPLLTDRHRRDIVFTAPAAGTVREVARGPRRSLSALVIDLEDDAAVMFDPLSPDADADDVRDLLLRSGQWPAFLRRPFGTIPDPDEQPHAIFVAAMDTDPLAVDPSVVLAERRDDFRRGLAAIARLTDGTTYVCHGGAVEETGLPEGVRAVRFSGPHPAGLAGTHIHRLAPVGPHRAVWQIGYQDVAAIGSLVSTGQIDAERIVSVAGPSVKDPRLVRTVAGADIDDLVDGLKPGDHRVISGSILTGRASRYLGRRHTSVSVLPEAKGSAPLGWAEPPQDTSQHGQRGTFVPVAAFDTVLPFNILAVPLLRSLIIGDEEAAERLGCLELLEEDMALFSYVCPAKINYAPLLRNVLDKLAGAV